MPPPEDVTLRKLVEAVTSLANGLNNSERRSQRRHEDLMDALVIALTGNTKPNGHAIEATKRRGGEVSATFIVEGSRVEITEEHVKIIKSRIWRWVLVVIGLAASGIVGWIKGHMK